MQDHQFKEALLGFKLPLSLAGQFHAGSVLTQINSISFGNHAVRKVCLYNVAFFVETLNTK